MILDSVRRLLQSGLLDHAITERTRSTPQQRPTLIKNVSGEEIPPYSIVQTKDTVEFGGRTYLEVDKFDEDVFGSFCLVVRDQSKTRRFRLLSTGAIPS